MNTQNMTDKELMEDVLLTSKTISELYHFAVQESSTATIHNQFKTTLNEALDMQNQIYTQMSSHGWYPQQQAQQNQIEQVRNKFMQANNQN